MQSSYGWTDLQGVTQIKYCTDGVLLREMMEDPLLTTYRSGSMDISQCRFALGKQLICLQQTCFLLHIQAFVDTRTLDIRTVLLSLKKVEITTFQLQWYFWVGTI